MSGRQRKRTSLKLAEVLTRIDSTELAESFLDTFVTEGELEKINGRLRAALAMVNSDMSVSQEECASQTKCAIAVVGRVSRRLRRNESHGLLAILRDGFDDRQALITRKRVH